MIATHHPIRLLTSFLLVLTVALPALPARATGTADTGTDLGAPTRLADAANLPVRATPAALGDVLDRLVPAQVLTDSGDLTTLDVVDGDAPSRLRAGVAEGLLRVPVGVPLGGYLRPPVGGEQFGSQTPDHHTDSYHGFAEDGTPLVTVPDEARTTWAPWANLSPPSRGYHDALVTKALALDDGTDVAVIVKVDTIGMLDELTLAVADRVRQATGEDIADGLIMTATHTHDGPGAVASDSVRYFWAAVDTYQPEVFDLLADDIAAVVVEALANRVPARIGHLMGSESRASSLNSFRRARGPWAEVPGRVEAQEAFRRRLGVIRVDEVDADGNPGRPLSIVMNYAAHGIIFDVENLFFSGDALGGAERYVEAAYDEPVVAMYVQSAAGDVSPRADGRPKLQRIERFGNLLGEQVLALAEAVTAFQDAPDIEVASQRVQLNREALGYEGDEYPHPWGAVQCNNGDTAAVEEVAADRNCVSAPPPDAWDLADNGHAENASFVPLDTRVTAARIGDFLIAGQPGEPTVEQGLQIAERSPLPLADTFIFGYAQDHVGYITPDNREDWLLGDTEGTTTFWGWKQGGRLRDASVDLLAALVGEGPLPASELEVSYIRRPYVALQATPSADPGTVVRQPSDIARFQATSFWFGGGDPIRDLPTVTLQRQVDGRWVYADGRGGRPVDAPYEYELTYQVTGQATHTWQVDFEAPKDWPAGTYRFLAEGVANGGAGYRATSAPFEVSPAQTLQVVSVTREGDRVRVRTAYTPVPENKRLIDAEVPSDQLAPVRTAVATLTLDGVTVTASDPTIVAVDGGTAAELVATLPGEGLPVVSVIDAFGNRSG